MVLFNYSTKEITAKIVYYGPGLCGKTTNLQFIYDNLPRTINKGKMLSLATKTDRTLFFDFLPIDLGTIRGMRTRLQLYTVPGQVFYNTTRKLVLKGADGVVFVADSQRRMIEANLESFGNLQENLAEHDMNLSEMPMILQFNKRDLPDVASIEELNAALNKFNAPIYEAVAPTGIGVHETLKAITRLVLNSLKERYADKREQKADAQTKAKASAVMAAISSRTPSINTRAAAQPPAQEAVHELPSKPVVPHHSVDTATSVPETASLSSAQLPPAMKDPALSLSPADAEPLTFDLPELEELSERDAQPPDGEPIEAASVDAPEPEFLPELMSIEPSTTDLMAEGSADLAGEEDLLEVLPEPELPTAAGGEELLELADEPLADLAYLEDSIAMPLLDVTSEIAFDEEPVLTAATEPEPEVAAIAISADMSVVDDFDSMSPEGKTPAEAIFPLESLPKPPAFEDDVFDESFFEPVEAGALVAEDHHDTSLPIAELASVSTVAPIPLALELVAQPHREESDIFSSSIAPRIPVSDLASPPLSVVKAVSCAAGIAREINLPVKLEIGGRCISFALKISLDLAEASADTGSAGQDEREARS